MDWWLANFFLGAILSLFLPVVPDLFLLFALLLFSISFFTYGFNVSKSLRLSSGLFFGASWMLFNAYSFQQIWQQSNLSPIEISAKSHWLQGKVTSLQLPITLNKAQLSEKKTANKPIRFNFNVTHIDDVKLATTINMRLSWKKAKLLLQQGQTLLLKVKFKPAHGLANLGGFSYQTWLNSKHISATGYVINHKSNQLLSAIRTTRQQLFADYQQLLPKHELAPLLLALGFGSRSELTPELWRGLQATGTGHLIAISGLHIGLVATGSYFLIMLLIRSLPLSLLANSHQLQRINSRYYAISISMIIALSYGYLAGFSLPTIRALVMLSLYWGVRLLGLKISIKRWLLLTLFVLTLTTPFSLFTASFWLSVYAVTVICLTLWRFKGVITTGSKLWRFVKGLLIIQLSLTLMLLPISAIFFQQISALALFSNVIAVPWMSFVTIPLCLLSVLLMPISVALSQFLIMLCLETMQYLWAYLDFLSTQPWAVIALASADIQLLVFVGILSVLVLFQVRLTFSYKNMLILLGFFAVIVAAMPFNKHIISPKSKGWQLVVFDVGQGLSVLVKKNDKAILYDTGASYPSGFNMIEAVVLPYLQHQRIEKLDKVIISHSDNDHAGGLVMLQQAMPIDELTFNSSKKPSSKACLQGESFNWQGLTFQMIWPENQVAKENDDSCVLLISDGKHQVLLTGDISKKVEQKLLEKFPNLRADVVVVPHHGSKTSSSDSFINKLTPELAIVSAGFLNRWHMPVTEVVQRYQDNNIELLNTATSGQIIINFSNDFSTKSIVKQTYHDDLWPFWFANSL